MDEPLTTALEQALVAPARRGDSEAFARLAEPYRPALMRHCYRMLGSPFDAEDAVQETLLRAWRGIGGFREASSFRTWLYRIATNVCLDTLSTRAPRTLPQGHGPAVEGPPTRPPAFEVRWLAPYPDVALEHAVDPSSAADIRFNEREDVRLAFVAALQYLPARQRAALLLRDVLHWRAEEVAEALDMSATAVHSATQRGRAALRRAFPSGRPDALPELDESQRALLDRYVRAWEDGDLHALVALLREEIILSMPPTLDWYEGRRAVAEFFAWAWMLEGLGPFRLVPTTANSQPAFGLYGRNPTGPGFVPQALQVLELDGPMIRSITGFIGAELFPLFGLPAELPE